jgi:hypothetical protein
MALVANDSVYIPAGVPSRIITRTLSLQVRFKAETPGREAVVWYCETCDSLLFWREIDTATEIPQVVYWDATQAFNSDAAARTCRGCGAVNTPAELGDIAWHEVAEAIRAGAGAEK